MVDEILNIFQGLEGILGFASAEVAWAYIGCILASLLCVIYGLIPWSRYGGITRVRSSGRGRRVKRGKRPLRRR